MQAGRAWLAARLDIDFDTSFSLDIVVLEPNSAKERAQRTDELDFKRPSISVNGCSTRAGGGEMNWWNIKTF